MPNAPRWQYRGTFRITPRRWGKPVMNNQTERLGPPPWMWIAAGVAAVGVLAWILTIVYAPGIVANQIWIPLTGSAAIGAVAGLGYGIASELRRKYKR